MSAPISGPDEVIAAAPHGQLCNSLGCANAGRVADVVVTFGTFGSHWDRTLQGEPAMDQTYLVAMPPAEARHLAGTSPTWPAAPEHHLAAALREWLAGISRGRSAVVSVRKVVTDLTLILETSPLPRRPVRGPFGPGRNGPPLTGWVEYLGCGIVRLDETAISALASLPPGHDFRTVRTDAGPVLTVGTEEYLAREEQPAPRHEGQPARPDRVADT